MLISTSRNIRVRSFVKILVPVINPPFLTHIQCVLMPVLSASKTTIANCVRERIACITSFQHYVSKTGPLQNLVQLRAGQGCRQRPQPNRRRLRRQPQNVRLPHRHLQEKRKIKMHVHHISHRKEKGRAPIT